MKQLLVLGTNNPHKAAEIAPFLAGLPVDLKMAGNFGPFDPVEDGLTLEANALVKARAAMDLSGAWAFADDTALEVDPLGGRPGIHAARYAGLACRPSDNIRKLLGELTGTRPERRTARFICLIGFCRPGQEPRFFRGVCEGRILETPRGREGFGYDPIFLPQGQERSFAELSFEEKNRISHRAQASRAFASFLRSILPPS